MPELGERTGSTASIWARVLSFALGMSLFAAGWWWVIARQDVDLTFLIWVVVGLIGIAAVTTLWILWNLRIHRVKGPRSAPHAPVTLPATDQLDRKVVLEPGSRDAARVVLALEGEDIVFRPVPSSSGDSG